jgi:hypothetical protein
MAARQWSWMKPPTVAALFLCVGSMIFAQAPANEASEPQQQSQTQQAQQPATTNSKPLTAVDTSTFSASELQSLPAEGRHWQDFVLDSQAGTSGSLAPDSQRQTTFSVDGASLGLAFGNSNEAAQGSYPQGSTSESGTSGSGLKESALGHSWNGGHGFAFGEAAIRDVQSAAGRAEAAANRSGGGQLTIETESGSNQLHGQGFLFNRQNIWGAKNPYSQWVRESSAGTLTTVPVFTAQPYTPSDRETTWGLGIGGRINPKQLFWFAALDGFERNDPGVSMVRHADKFFDQPTNDQMQVLSARLGLSSLNPVAEGIAAYSSMLETLAGLLGPAQRKNSQWVGFMRLDWQATERNRFTLEGIGAHADAPGGGISRVSANYGNRSFGSSLAGKEWLLLRWEAYATPNLLFTTQSSAGREIVEARPQTPSTYEQTLLRGNSWGQLPQIVVDSRYGFTIGNPARFGEGSYPDERLFQIRETADWVHGKLLVKSGFDVSRNRDAISLLRNRTGTYYYSSVENFVSDALAFAAFGISGQLNPYDQHNCDQTGSVWRDSSGGLHGLGYLPCYSYYKQTIGPGNWWLTSTDWAGYTTAQWQPHKQVVLSAGLRYEFEHTPPPIVALNNPDLPLTARSPSLGSGWGPRVGMAIGSSRNHLPVLRLGYGIYFGRTENAVLETALTHTGSVNGDLNYFLRPTDNLVSGGAPPFPYVLTGQPGTVVKPGVVQFASSFRNPQIHQAEASMEESLPGHFKLTATAEFSLGRHLPISIDTNLDPAALPQTITYAVIDGTGKGPIQTAEITVPFYTARLDTNYQQIATITSRANSTYEAVVLKLARNTHHNFSFRLNYTYAHAMDWNPNETAQVAGSNVLDPADFSREYGTSNLDERHSASTWLVWNSPWKLHHLAGALSNGWIISGIGRYHSGFPYTMRTSGSLPREFNVLTGAAIVGVGPGINGSGGDNRLYGFGNNNQTYNIGRNTYRYPNTWKADLRLTRSIKLKDAHQLELLAESYNLFNHRNITEIETTGYYIDPGSSSGALPGLNFLTGAKPNSTAFGQPLSVNASNFYRERRIQFGARFRY